MDPTGPSKASGGPPANEGSPSGEHPNPNHPDPMSKPSKSQFKRCNWMMQSKGWKDCGRKATRIARGTGMYYCTEHASHVIGWRYDMAQLTPTKNNP